MLHKTLLFLFVALTYWSSSAVFAQQNRIARIGFLTLIPLTSDSRIPSFIQGLKELGYIEGKSITIEWRSAEGRADKLPELARDLMQRKVAVIVAIQPQAISAAHNLTREIPIVFAAAQDPVGMGIANSLSRPGRNVTGTSGMATDLLPKQLEILQQVVPGMSRVAILLNPTNPAGSRVVREKVEAAAASANVRLVFIDAQSTSDVYAAFQKAKQAQVQAVLSGPDSFFIQARSDMARAAIDNKLPTMFMQREHAVAGGLLSYGPNIGENYRRVAYYVDRILKGAKASDLPIEQPAKLEFVINLKTANAMGISIATDLLVRADEIIK